MEKRILSLEEKLEKLTPEELAVIERYVNALAVKNPPEPRQVLADLLAEC